MSEPIVFWDDTCALMVVSGTRMLILTEEDLARARTEVYRKVPADKRPEFMSELTKAFMNYRKAATEKAIMRFTTSDK